MGETEQSDGELPPPTRNLMLSVRVEAFACIELITIVGVAAYVFLTPPPERTPRNITCLDLSCFNLGQELYTAMDLRSNPCDDFYQYTCGRWAQNHPEYEDQFRYLEARVYRTANDKLRERLEKLPPPDKPLSGTDKAALSYLACVEVQTRHIDVPWKITELLFMRARGEDGSGSGSLLEPTTGKLATRYAALRLLMSLALDLDIDVLFKILLAPDPRTDSRRIVSVAHSESLLKWKRHREQLMTPAATATCIREFVNVLSTEHALRAHLAAALVKMDAEVSTKMAAAAAMSLGGGVFVTFAQLPALEAAMVAPPATAPGATKEAGHASDPNAKPATPSTSGDKATGGGGDKKGGEAANPWLAAFNAALGDKGNVTDDEPLFAADPRLFSLVREVLDQYPTSHVRYYTAFHVVRHLAPFTSYRLVESLFSPDNKTAAMVYYADACAAAASRLTSFALASYVFQDLVPKERVQAAYDHLDALKNRTAAVASSWLAQPDQRWALQRLNSLKSMVAWPSRFNDSTGAAVDQFLAHLPDFQGYYVEIYVDAVSAIRNREKAQLLDRTPGSKEKIAREEDGPFPGMRPTIRYSAWYGSVLVSPSAVLQPLFFNGSDPLSMGAFGHLAAHELWHAALGEVPLGVAPQSDLTLGDEQLKRHQCVADIYTKAGAAKGDAAKGSSENVADVVGLEVAYAVYREGNGSSSGSTSSGDGGANVTDVTGFTAQRLFFIASCLKWCAATPDALSKTSLGYATPRLRCNVPVAMLDGAAGFTEAFGCKAESKMVKMAAGPNCTAVEEMPLQPPRAYNITG
ncbi:neprilysin-2-like [Dermacentor silvarum]|uniref:neprilysin-2-like n=1 Tax=Dermacentor silvarum TaxID=543639 RepID=UPI0018978684|nr:neprilysin-2-like [Dermacentor silvarum]